MQQILGGAVSGLPWFVRMPISLAFVSFVSMAETNCAKWRRPKPLWNDYGMGSELFPPKALLFLSCLAFLLLEAAELQFLLQFPNEKTTVEHKSWLNLGENHGKATLAKAAIALANEGGGIVVLGMREDNTQGGALGSQLRPATLGRYSQDAVNAAINRYADPQFHCELAFATHLGTNIEHAFVFVPGGMTVPVMSKRDCQGIIVAQRCYVRKPGPKTEEPFTAEEWRGVMERCLAARRESMLDAIRVIVQGHGTLAPEALFGEDFETA